MIFDNLRNLSRYLTLSDNFRIAFEFLSKAPLDSMQIGDIGIHGEEVYAFVKTTLLEAENKRWEAHQRYADIQIVLEGAEEMWYQPHDAQEIEVGYDAKRDVMFYREMRLGTRLRMHPKDFVVFFPQELHRPDCPVVHSEITKKLVIKVKA